MTINTFKILKANKLNINFDGKYCIYYDHGSIYQFIVLDIIFLLLIVSTSLANQSYELLPLMIFPLFYLLVHLNKILLKHPVIVIDNKSRKLYNLENQITYSFDKTYYSESTVRIFKFDFDLFSLYSSKNDTCLFSIKYIFIRNNEVVRKYMEKL